jgi:acetyltransferase-like isoleucine patch superfamily enzyme
LVVLQRIRSTEMKKLLRLSAYWLANRLFLVTQKAQRARLANSFKSCGQNVSLYMPVRIDGAENVEVGDNVAISAFVNMWGQGGIKIGSGVLIGAHTEIASASHDFNKEFMYKTLVQNPVVIEDYVWIGAHCVILPGVIIGKGALVGAGSVVSRNVEPYTIVVTGRERQEWPRRFSAES